MLTLSSFVTLPTRPSSTPCTRRLPTCEYVGTVAPSDTSSFLFSLR